MDDKTAASIRTLKNLPFFSKFSERELPDLEKFITKRRFSKNEMILLEEETSNYMYVVYSGKVKVVQISADGKEHILAIHKEGDFFGEMALLDGKTSPANVIAMEDSYIGLIHKSTFEVLLRNNKVLTEIISLLCSRLRESWLMLKVLSFADAEHKIRMTLKLLSEQYGKKDPRGIIINLKLTHKDIADYASLSRETVTRLLDRLLKAEEIEILENKNILLKASFFEKIPLL